MHAHHAQPHYTPTSVGALMDPAFVRDAATDAYGAHAVVGTSLRTVRLRFRAAVQALAARFRRR